MRTIALLFLLTTQTGCPYILGAWAAGSVTAPTTCANHCGAAKREPCTWNPAYSCCKGQGCNRTCFSL